MSFQRVFTGTPWESKVGYCRAIRAGDHIYVNVVTEASEEPPERHDVEIGIVDGDRVQILSGLNPGDKVSLQ